MIGLGHYNTLSLKRKTDFGWFLEDDEETEILLPNKYCSKSFKVGDSIEVFCYLDSNERPVATTLSPKIERGKFRFLKVKSITKSGAFLDMVSNIDKNWNNWYELQRKRKIASIWKL